MSLVTLLFYVFALLTVGSALGVLLFRNVLYAAFTLLLTFLGLAGLYVLAGADLLAVIQIVIYVGGILVLLVFGVMLTQRTSQEYPASRSHNHLLGLLVAGGLFTLFLIMIVQVNAEHLGWIASASSNAAGQQSTLAGIGLKLMTDAVLPFEVAGILLLIALIGAAYIAGKGQNR